MFSKSHANAKAQQQQENDKRLPKGMQAGGRRGKDPRLANLYLNSSNNIVLPNQNFDDLHAREAVIQKRKDKQEIDNISLR